MMRGLSSWGHFWVGGVFRKPSGEWAANVLKSRENVYEKTKPPKQAVFSIFGGDDRTRTDYLYVANVSLSQVSYAPISDAV